MKTKRKMSMFKKGGFNPRPDTSYQSPASKAARKNVAKKSKMKQDISDLLMNMVAEQTGEFAEEMQDALKKRLKSGEYKLPSNLKPPKSFEGGGKNDPPKGKAPALSPTGRLLDDPRPQEEEKEIIPYFLRKSYFEGGRKSEVAEDGRTPYERGYDKRSAQFDRFADNAEDRINQLIRSGKYSKETAAKAKKALKQFRASKGKAMRDAGYGIPPEQKNAQDRAIRRMNKKAKDGMKMPKYKKGGFNPFPDTSYQSSASKSARKNVAKKQKEQDMADTEFIRSLLRMSRHMTLDGSKGEKFNVPKRSKQ